MLIRYGTLQVCLGFNRLAKTAQGEGWDGYHDNALTRIADWLIEYLYVQSEIMCPHLIPNDFLFPLLRDKLRSLRFASAEEAVKTNSVHNIEENVFMNVFWVAKMENN